MGASPRSASRWELILYTILSTVNVGNPPSSLAPDLLHAEVELATEQGAERGPVGVPDARRDLIHARTAPPESETDIPRPVWLAEFARSAVLVFAFTAAIHQLGVAEDFVLLSFALLFGGLCLAAALAFGLGSREVAGEIVRDRWNKAKKPTTPSPLGGARPPMPSSPSPSSSGTFGKPTL